MYHPSFHYVSPFGTVERYSSLYSISTKGSIGRFGNQFIRNIFVSMLAKQYDLAVEYTYEEDMKQLGITLFHGKRVFSTEQTVTDQDVLQMIQGNKAFTESNLVLRLNQSFFQDKESSLLLYSYLKKNQDKIREQNPFCIRYGNNNNAFVHLRLDDAAEWNPGYDYYEKALEQCMFDKVYLSTDSKRHEMVDKLMKRFPTMEWNPYEDIIQTWQFASTCKHIILSHGSFSALIGYLSFNSDVYRAPYGKSQWHGDMFSIPGWKVV